jgi:hypothetical protein
MQKGEPNNAPRKYAGSAVLWALAVAGLPGFGDAQVVHKQTVSPTAAAPVTVAVWPDGKMPARRAREPEADLPSKDDNVRRITNVSRPT